MFSTLLSPLEQRIWTHYNQCGVRTPGDITLFHWDKKTRVKVKHRPGPTNALPTRETYMIFLNSEKSLPERRVEVAHEIGHALLHTGFQSQEESILRSIQEKQANRFSLYALAPSPLIWKVAWGDHWGYSVTHLSIVFGVPEWFMDERLLLFKRNMQNMAPNLFRKVSKKYDWGC